MAESQNTMWLFLKNFSNKFSISDLVNGNGKGNGSTTSSRKHVSYNKLDTHDKGDFLSSSNPNLQDIVGVEDDISSHTPAGHADNLSTTNANIANNPSISTSSKSQSVPQSLSSSASASLVQVQNQKSQPFSAKFGTFFGGGGAVKTGVSSSGRSADFNAKTKKFTFPNRVPTAQQKDQGKEQRHLSGSGNKSSHTNITENVKDSNWLDLDEDESDDDIERCDEDVTSSCTSDYEDDDEDERNGTRCGICGCEKKYEVACGTNVAAGANSKNGKFAF